MNAPSAPFSRPFWSQVEMATGGSFVVSWGPFKLGDVIRALHVSINRSLINENDGVALLLVENNYATFAAGVSGRRLSYDMSYANYASEVAGRSILYSSSLSSNLEFIRFPLGVGHHVPLNLLMEGPFYLSLFFSWAVGGGGAAALSGWAAADVAFAKPM